MNKKGFTLVELMVSMFVAMVVFGGVFASFQNQKMLFLRQEAIIKLNSDRRAAVEILNMYIARGGISTDSGSGFISDLKIVDGNTIHVTADENFNDIIDSDEKYSFIVDNGTLYFCTSLVRNNVNNKPCSPILENITTFNVIGCNAPNNVCGVTSDVTNVTITLNSESPDKDKLGLPTSTPVVTQVLLLNKLFQERN